MSFITFRRGSELHFPPKKPAYALRSLNFLVKIELGEYDVFIEIFLSIYVLKPVLKVIFS